MSRGIAAIVFVLLGSPARGQAFETPTVKDTDYPYPPAAVFVAPWGSPGAAGTLAEPLSSVGEAVDAATDSDFNLRFLLHVRVRPGWSDYSIWGENLLRSRDFSSQSLCWSSLPFRRPATLWESRAGVPGSRPT